MPVLRDACARLELGQQALQYGVADALHRLPHAYSFLATCEHASCPRETRGTPKFRMPPLRGALVALTQRRCHAGSERLPVDDEVVTGQEGTMRR
jgi:hypothetical protein